jgi:hypothetical protein
MFRSVRLLVVVVLAVATMVLGSVHVAFADSNLGDVPLHRHFIEQPDGTLVEVGPQVCENPDLQAAFNQFHHNVHRGALGLHDHHGAEITAMPGCP